MRLVAEIGLVALARETGLGVAWIDAAALIRTPHGASNEGRVDQRAALDDKAERLELAVDRGQQLRRQAKLVDRLAKPPDRGVVRRLHLQRQPAETTKRQTVAHRLLGGWIRERVPLLQE